MSTRGFALRSATVLVAVWIVAATPVQATGADEDATSEGAAPDATITFRGRSAAVGVGFIWGASTLDYRGRTYPVRADGFVLGAIGTASVEGTGKVFHLSKVEDLNGVIRLSRCDLTISSSAASASESAATRG